MKSDDLNRRRDAARAYGEAMRRYNEIAERCRKLAKQSA
jgi:hypothetical protein